MAADEPVTRQLYGGGVHAYFAKDYKEAFDLLSTAVASKSEDPRVYYFRGLAQWQLGRPDEAKADFTTGADLEATATDDLYSIDKAMERIQGKPRLAIETARVAARNRAAQKRLKEDELRFNRIRSNEPNILEGVKPPPKVPAKTPEPPKANPSSPPPEGTAEFDPLREARLPVAPAKAAPAKELAGDPKPAPKAVEAAPAKEPEPSPVEPKVVAKAKADPAPRPASPPGKKATTAMARIIGKLAQQYVDEMAESIQQQASGGLGPLPIPPPQP
jgi:hypothetical protein